MPTLRHIAREGRTYVIGVTSCLRRRRPALADLPGRAGLVRATAATGSPAATAPSSARTARSWAGPLAGEEGVLYAEIDTTRAQTSRQQFDPVGHYNRPDIFRLVYRHLTPPRSHRAHFAEEP